MARSGKGQVLEPIERRDQPRLMRRLHLLQQRQQRCQHIVGLEPALLHAGFEKFQERNVGGRVHGSLASALASISAACSLTRRTSRTRSLSSFAASFSNWVSNSS